MRKDGRHVSVYQAYNILPLSVPQIKVLIYAEMCAKAALSLAKTGLKILLASRYRIKMDGYLNTFNITSQT
jgi:hypothetical protein